MQHYDCLIVDLVNLFYRLHNRGKILLRCVNTELLGVQGIINTVEFCQNMQRNTGARLHAVVDNYTSGVQRRQRLDPEYKFDRVKQSPGFYRMIDAVQELLCASQLDVRVTKVPGYEADDLVPAVLAHEACESALLVSSDLDWARSLTKNVHWFNFIRVYTPSIFEAEFGFSPAADRVIRYKAYRGDSGDHIPPGAPGLPEAKVRYLVEYGPVKTVLQDVDILDLTYAQKLTLKSNARRILLNEELVGFQPLEGELAAYIREGRDEPAVVSRLCMEYGLNIDKLFPEVVRRHPDYGLEPEL